MTEHLAGTNNKLFKNSEQNTEPVFTLKEVRQVKENQTVLDGINLEIAPGEVTALVGPSGAGKTSLLRLLNRLDDAASGEIYYRSHPINKYAVQELRRQVGFVFQTPIMFPGSIADNLRKALELAGKPVTDSQGLIAEMLALAELDSTLAERDGSRLSVGQKQRVNIARALMNTPQVLLMDEPTSALDSETADKLMETVRRLGKEKNITIVMITHRLSEARRTSDKTIVMAAGKIIETGATEFIFGQRANPRISEFLASGK